MASDKDGSQEIVQKIDKSKDSINKSPPNRNPMGLNVAVARQIGSESGFTGTRDFRDQNAQPIDEHTMFAEASIGKVRYAGLGYMLQQDGILVMQSNAKDLFSESGFADFLEEKYKGNHHQGIGKEMQEQILQSFPEGDKNKAATLADLTTHYAGVGDLTRDHFETFKEKGLEHNYDFPSLLKPPSEGMVVPRDSHGKPFHGMTMKPAEYGKHQYSNHAYMMFAEAMEYSSFQKTGEMESYKDLMDVYMLHPTRGRGEESELKDRLSFDSTKFADQLKESDNIVIATNLDLTKEKTEVNANTFNGAHAAGGMFASIYDSAKFFGKFFKGFPGTDEYGEDVNPFFSQETINAMQEEWQSRPAGIDKANNYQRYQAPGFAVSVDGDGKIVQYDKGGDTPGSEGMMMKFIPSKDPGKSMMDILLQTQENLTTNYAKELGITPQELMDTYQGKDGKFNRTALYQDHKEKGIEGIKEKVHFKQVAKGLAQGMGKVELSNAKKIEAQKTPEAGNVNKGMGI